MARLMADNLRRLSFEITSQRMARLTTNYMRMARLMAHNQSILSFEITGQRMVRLTTNYLRMAVPDSPQPEELDL